MEQKSSIEERAVELAHYIIESKDTVRGAAKKYGISKSTVHKDVSERLKKINPGLAKEVREILEENKAERHIRGGMATKLKYSHMKENKKLNKTYRFSCMSINYTTTVFICVLTDEFKTCFFLFDSTGGGIRGL